MVKDLEGLRNHEESVKKQPKKSPVGVESPDLFCVQNQ